jgi:hypothetical protein
MSVIHVGFNSEDYEISPEREITVDKEGSVVVVDVWRGHRTGLIPVIPAVGTGHPEYSFCKLENVVFREEDGNMASARLIYRGVGASGGGGGGGAINPTLSYTYEAALNEEPLLSHVKAKELDEVELTALQQIINGNEDKPDGGKWKDDITTAVAKTFLNRIRKGFTSTLRPTVTYTETGTSDQSQSSFLGTVGDIDSPPGAFNPPGRDGRAWLAYSFQETTEGDGYRYQKVWLLSGATGWDNYLYGNAGPDPE